MHHQSSLTKRQEIVHIDKCKGHYTRLERKLTLIQKKYKFHSQKQIDLVLHFEKKFTEMMQLSNSMSREMSIQLNGFTIDGEGIGYHEKDSHLSIFFSTHRSI